MQLEYAEKEDSYLRSKEVSENTVLIHFTLHFLERCGKSCLLLEIINVFSRRAKLFELNFCYITKTLLYMVKPCGGAVASWLMRSTPERALWVRALAGNIVLCSWARHFTLTVPLSTQVYKWVPANLMLGVTLRWTSIQSRGAE